MSHEPIHETPAPVTALAAPATPRRGLGKVLRSLAGAVAGWRRNRRGSFLVIVVGTLAILAVLAVVFSTVGRHDARMTYAGQRREKLDDIPQQVADYIATLIGEDTLSVYYESTLDLANNQPIPLLRKTATYPSTDWDAKSDVFRPRGSAGKNLPTFSPTGSVAGFMTSPDRTNLGTDPLNRMPAAWRPTTPWLASTEPILLNYARSNALPTDPTRLYLDNRDWAHISNIAPDGRFVNLVNLRNNWGAASGANPSPTTPAKMSDGLSLFDPATGRVQSGPSAFTDFNVQLDFNTPAHLDSRQVWMFRPARPTLGVAPSSPGYEPNQYADADGDGMYDSRWQELKDTRFLPALLPSEILHTDGKYRWFVATRIVDASAMVNVNFAADSVAAPQAHQPAGLTPAEIDLRRLLLMHDTYADAQLSAAHPHGGYDGIFQPGQLPFTGNNYAGDAVPSNYGPTPNTPPSNAIPGSLASGYDQVRAFMAGDYAYTALRLALGSGSIPPSYYRGMGNRYANGTYASLSNPANPAGYFPADFTVDSPFWRPTWDFGPLAAPFSPIGSVWTPTGLVTPASRDVTTYRTGYYQGKAVAFQDTRLTNLGGLFTGSFGKDDLLELITRRAVNDPAFTSSLESTLDGRDDSLVGPRVFPDSTAFGPMRSNRGLDVERNQRYVFSTTPPINLNPGFPYDRTMLHFAADIRQRLTTLSGGRNFRSLTGVFPDQLMDAELRVDPRPLLGAIEAADSLTQSADRFSQPPRTGDANYQANLAAVQTRTEAINRLFTAYCDALLPTSGIGRPWGGGSNSAARATEFYGYKGPELAIHAAAHMTVNMADSFDKLGSAYHADLRGEYEVPSHTVAGSGTVEVTITPGGAGFFLNFTVSYQNLQGAVNGLRVYGPAAPGAATSTVVGTAINFNNPPPAQFSGQMQISAQDLANLKAGTLCFDLRTTAFPNGEIRGQILSPAPKPTVLTLKLSSDNATTTLLRNQSDFFAGWNDGPGSSSDTYQLPPNLGGSGLHALELPAQRLGNLSNGDTMDAGAVNIYGVEAQPFISQVASFTVYADSNLGNRGQTSEVTIKGDVDFTVNNPDLMYRVIAFQLTNPFSVDIHLGGAPVYGAEKFEITDQAYPRLDQDPSFYYIRFGDGTGTDHIFKVASLEEKDDGTGLYLNSPTGDPNLAAMTISGITIPAGKTIAVYALSDTPRRIMNTRLATLAGSNLSTDPLDAGSFFNLPAGPQARRNKPDTFKQMVAHHLGASTPDIAGVYWMPEIDTPTTPLPPTATHNPGQVVIPKNTNLFPANAANLTARVADVTLWRSQRYGAEARTARVPLPTTYFDTTAAPNLRPVPELPAPNTFDNDQMVDRFRVTAGFDVDWHLPAGDQIITGTTQDAADPTKLYMMTVHASVHRQMDRVPPPVGALPAYCMEPKFATDWNKHEDDTFAHRSPIDQRTFVTPDFKGARTNPRLWYDGMTHSTFHFTYIDTAPNQLPTVQPSIERLTQTTTLDSVHANKHYDEVYPEICLANNSFTAPLPAVGSTPPGTVRVVGTANTLRPADMLLPMGIGPEEMPFDLTGAAIADMNKRWTTLGEALALSLGYQPAPTGTPPMHDVTFAYFVNPASGDPQVLDRGNLRLDNYVPYDKGHNGTFDAAQGDHRIGLEIPLALNILDIFTAPQANAETLTRGTPGTININTAPLPTLRTLDILSPPPAQDMAGNNWWWWQPVGANKPPLRETSDIAATVVGFREKVDSYLRPGSEIPATPPATSGLTAFVDFGDEDGSGNPVRPDVAANLNGRSISASIAGLHEQPGFGSVGELMAVRRRNPAAYALSAAWPCNIDFLGYDQQVEPYGTNQPAPAAGVSGTVGLDSVLYNNPNYNVPNPPANTPPKIPSMVPNSYKEQLEIINGVLNNVTTRSDYFIVWFQLQGYQESDVKNLGPNDPMIPSVNRRFVMVVDRSKVFKRGQKADIVLFKEVPVDPEPR
jgi:hypothetical protein